MRSSDSRPLRLIALFKLLKALLLVIVGVSGLRLIHTDITGLATEWVLRLGLDPGSRQVGRFLVKAAALTPSRLRELGVGSLVYAGLFLTEGLGLWRLKRWAEWLTVLITSSLVPVEAYEIYQHPTVVRVLLVLVNLGVVAYLVYRIRSDRAK
ncbi:MAG TPA: DUF2127 domain-containing protein [Candidatus Acidoferrum sp.]|nr:DUF2127 domain-containing protein [Candidatus Acidoferrum sp.]